MPKTGEALMTTEEAAAFLGVTAATIRKHARQGKLPAQKIGRQWRFPREALLRWLEGPDDGDNLAADRLSTEDLAAVRRGLKDIAAGRLVPWAQLRRELEQ